MKYIIALLMLVSIQASAQRKLSQIPVGVIDTSSTFVGVNKLSGVYTDYRFTIPDLAGYVGGTVDLRIATDNGNHTNKAIAIVGLSDSVIVDTLGIRLFNESGGSAFLVSHGDAITSTCVLPPKDKTLSWELTTKVKTDAPFLAHLDELYILPTLTASRNITFTDVPSDGDKMVFVNHNGSGNQWLLTGWSFVGFDGSDNTAISNLGSYRLIYVGALSKWVQY